jgi:mono/diheme cytochrome c family protein
VTVPVALGLALACLLAACPGSQAQAQAQGPQGAELAGRLGCLACHAPNRTGSKLAAPLDGVGGRLTARELATAITYPRQRHPQAKMPSYAYLPPMEQAALVEFLQTLK